MGSPRRFSILCDRPQGARFEFRVAPDGKIVVYLVGETDQQVLVTDPTSMQNVVMGFPFETPDGFGGRTAMSIQDGMIQIDHRSPNRTQSVGRVAAVEFGRQVQGLGGPFFF